MKGFIDLIIANSFVLMFGLIVFVYLDYKIRKENKGKSL
jgi:hypothetical protein